MTFDDVDITFMPNAALLFIPPLLYSSEAAMNLGIEQNELLVDGRLRNCFCGVFIRSMDRPSINDKIYVLVRAETKDDSKFIFNLMHNPLYVRHYRVFIRNIAFTVIVYNRSYEIQHTIDILEEKPITCLPQEIQRLIKDYWKRDKDILFAFEANGNMSKVYSMRTDIIPPPKPYEFIYNNELTGDKSYYETSLHIWQ